MTDSELPSSQDSTGDTTSNSSTSPIVPASGITMNLEFVKKMPELNFLSYCKAVAHLGQEIEEKTGIPKLIPIVQSAHESRNGNSGLARNHCNLFGITATDSWKKNGNLIANMPTFEYIKGQRVEMKREFRGYKSWLDSFNDWARIITTLSIYRKACEQMRDPATVIDGINSMALIYATDEKYAQKLLALYNVARK